MAVQFYKGKVLFRDGQAAMSEKCCCCNCPPGASDIFYQVTFTYEWTCGFNPTVICTTSETATLRPAGPCYWTGMSGGWIEVRMWLFDCKWWITFASGNVNGLGAATQKPMGNSPIGEYPDGHGTYTPSPAWPFEMWVKDVVVSDPASPSAPTPSPSAAATPPFAAVSPLGDAAELCAACEVNGSCPSYCRTCGGGQTIVAPCPLGRW